MDQNEVVSHVFNKWAENYQERFMDVTLYAACLDLLCEKLSKKNAWVLDVACGPGNVSKYLLEKRPDLKITGIDLAENMIGLARKNNPGAEFRVMDCRDISRLEGKFDAVVLAFCLPYLSREESRQLIADAAKILNPGGFIYISTMEDFYSESGIRKSSDGKDELYQYFYEAETLKKIFEELGFSLVYTDRKRYPGRDGKEIVDLLLLAQIN